MTVTTVTVCSLQGLMNLPGRPVAAFDPEGLIFAAGISSESLKLYDLRSFDKVWNYHVCLEKFISSLVFVMKTSM